MENGYHGMVPSVRISLPKHSSGLYQSSVAPVPTQTKTRNHLGEQAHRATPPPRAPTTNQKTQSATAAKHNP
jgi:hypothetical protein